MDISKMPMTDVFALLDSLDWGISIFDENGRFLYVNRYVLKCSGRSRKFYYGKTVYDLQNTGIVNKTVVTQALAQKRKITRLQRSHSEDGKLQDFLVTACPIFDGDGNLKFLMADRIKVSDLQQKLKYVEKTESSDIVSFETASKGQQQFIYKSSVMAETVRQIERVADLDVNVLLQGESGSGKDVLANHLCRSSSVYGNKFIPINCASMPEALLESELFGYSKGAFTGALAQGKMGLIEAADGGTLFLDEINSMPLGLQGKLLRVLETKEVTRLGSVQPVRVNFRLVCASNQSIEECVNNKTFRADLFYRINVLPIEVPPLRERKEDIIPLVDFFLHRYCERYDLQKNFSENVYNNFLRYDWPGNVRELKNVVERMVIMSTADTITINEVPRFLLSHCNHDSSKSDYREVVREKDKEEDEKSRILDALEKNDGHRERTAEYLHISRRTLQYKLKKYGLI